MWAAALFADDGIGGTIATGGGLAVLGPCLAWLGKYVMDSIREIKTAAAADEKERRREEADRQDKFLEYLGKNTEASTSLAVILGGLKDRMDDQADILADLADQMKAGGSRRAGKAAGHNSVPPPAPPPHPPRGA